MMTDIIADSLTRIRNAGTGGKTGITTITFFPFKNLLEGYCFYIWSIRGLPRKGYRKGYWTSLGNGQGRKVIPKGWYLHILVGFTWGF